MSNFSSAFAATIRAARKKSGLSQLQLAELSGLSLDAIGSIEREVNVPSIDTAAKLIAALGINVSNVFNSVVAERDIAADRRTVEAELIQLIEEMDDIGASLALELCRAVAKAHPSD